MEKQRKMIQINPDFFKMGKTKKKKDKKQKMDLRQTVKPNNLKKQLLARIKNHQQEQVSKNAKSDESKIDEFKDDFNSSLNYLQNMIKEKKNKKQKKTRKKREHDTQSIINNTVHNTGAVHTMDSVHTMGAVHTMGDEPNNTASTVINTQSYENDNQLKPQLVQISTNPSPKTLPYGCLKNGTKPTYSQYMKTMKKPVVARPTTLILPPSQIPTKDIMERKEKLNKLKKALAVPKKEKIIKTINRKRTIKIFNLGKKNGKVSVLVKCGKTRKRIKEEYKILHSKCMLEVKIYLRKHNLIKAGTSAPENVLRKLYEDSFLAGDIYNKNSDILLHNYMEK